MQALPASPGTPTSPQASRRSGQGMPASSTRSMRPERDRSRIGTGPGASSRFARIDPARVRSVIGPVPDTAIEPFRVTARMGPAWRRTSMRPSCPSSTRGRSVGTRTTRSTRARATASGPAFVCSTRRPRCRRSDQPGASSAPPCWCTDRISIRPGDPGRSRRSPVSWRMTRVVTAGGTGTVSCSRVIVHGVAAAAAPPAVRNSDSRACFHMGRRVRGPGRKIACPGLLREAAGDGSHPARCGLAGPRPSATLVGPIQRPTGPT